jgi:hypothetical protein
MLGDARSPAHKVGRHLAHDDLHHDEVLEVAVRLEQGLAGEELDKDAADRKHVARVRPTKAEDDLGRAIVPGRDDGRVVLALKGRRAKVDQPNVGIVEQELLFVGRSLRDGASEDLVSARAHAQVSALGWTHS